MVSVIKGILLIVYIIVSIALTVIVLMQEGKQNGLGAIGGGASESYWGRNKGRSMEGGLARATKVLATVFILLSLVLNMNLFG